MDSTLITTLGDELYQAMTDRTMVDPLTSRHPGITIEILTPDFRGKMRPAIEAIVAAGPRPVRVAQPI